MERRELDLDTRLRRCRAMSRQALTVQSVQPGIEPARVAQPAQVFHARSVASWTASRASSASRRIKPGGRVQSREARADEHAEGLMIALACPLDESCWSTVPFHQRGVCRAHRY